MQWREKQKDRVTVLVGGGEKLPLLIIGKSNSPRSFSGIKSLPLEYMANAKAWMGDFQRMVTKMEQETCHPNVQSY